MHVRDYMSPAPITITVDADYKRAFEIIEEKDLHHIPVIDQTAGVVGIVARRDLQLAARYFHEAPVEVREVMHTPVVTIAPDADLAHAADLMREHGIGSLPVCDGGKGRLVGIITESDLLRALSDLLAKR